ncbi:WXG100 family type VII secretion target [Oceanobacillus sp. FSL W7-1293]|uniref:WXG100 family type VII secretion target n=1 Tax=Oceanobacillus sp. FSL W7-1293 TaxID=2921699 RepID=UPI0030D0FAD1
MAGQIRMSPEELQSKANAYGEGATDVNDVLQRLSNLQEQLRSEWEGRAFEQFDVQFQQLSEKVVDFTELLTEIQTQLKKTAEAVAQQDEALANNFGLK